MSDRPHRPVFTLKTAAQVYSVPIGELRRAIEAKELRMELVTVQEHRLTAETIEAWLTARASKAGER